MNGAVKCDKAWETTAATTDHLFTIDEGRRRRTITQLDQ
jgi:hypothetical protein